MLFDRELRGHGSARNVVGNLAEELTAEFVGGRRHKTNGLADYCPDVSRLGTDGVTEYFESKACGLSSQTFVYGGRLRRDEVFAAEHRLWYVVWHHRADTLMAAGERDLEQLVLASLRAVYVVPFAELLKVCQSLKEEPLNSNYGSARTRKERYGSGYRISLSLLRPWLARSFIGISQRPIERGF